MTGAVLYWISELVLRNLGCAVDISVMVDNDYNQTTTSENKWPGKNKRIFLGQKRCACVFLCAWSCMSMCTCVWRPEVTLSFILIVIGSH